MKPTTQLELDLRRVWSTGQGGRYHGKPVQVADIEDGNPVFKDLSGHEVPVDTDRVVPAPAFDKV